MRKTAGGIAFAGVSLALVLIAFAFAEHGYVGRASFKAFYCAGVAVREGRNPYRVEPLRSCERSAAPSSLPDGYVEPAPLPSYALAPFALLATLPLKAAAELFAVLLAVAAACSALCLGATLRVAPAAVLVALAPLTLLNVAYGEVPPIALLGMCLAAYLVAVRRCELAGFAVSLTWIQPNVGLTAALALFLFVPRSRITVAASAIFFAILGLAVLGIGPNIEYFNHLLPSMANAELVASDQYSLSHLLNAAGVSAAASLAFGKAWFVLIACLGILVAGILAKRRGEPELLPLLPPAAVMLFGIYLHDIQFLLALPAAIAVASRMRDERFRVLAAAALALLTPVWTQRASRSWVFLDAAGIASALLIVSRGTLVRRLGYAALGTLATIACVLLLARVEPPLDAGRIVTSDFHSAATDSAGVAWARYLRATPELTRSTFDVKIPTWIGLSFLMLAALRLCLTTKTEVPQISLASATPDRSGSRALQLATEPCSVSSQKCD